MRKIILPIIILSLFLSTGVLAQKTELSDAGLTPDSPFYFLEKIFERVSIFFTFGDLKKAERYAAYVNERIAEVQAVVEKGKPGAASIALERYEDQLGKALTSAEKAKAKGKSIEKVAETIAEATGEHLMVIEEVLEKVPEEAKVPIIEAKEVAVIGQKNALRGLAIENPERATEINLKAAESRLIRAKVKAEVGEIEKVEEAINEFEDQHKFGEEISQIAQGIGKDTTSVEQLVGKATAVHLKILAEVYEKIPESAKPTIEEAMTVSVKGHEKAVEVLQEKNALGEVPEIAPMPEEVPAEARERIQKEVKEEIEEEKAECLKEGETYMPGEDKQCCVGLEKMTVTYGDGTICTLPMGYVCTAFCGDGKCEGKNENACSCPEDCKEVKCLGLGQGINPSLPPEYSNIDKKCCEGLKLIRTKNQFDENCNFILMVGAGSVCTPCGNGICDEKYENACNCPDDCLQNYELIKKYAPECIEAGATTPDECAKFYFEKMHSVPPPQIRGESPSPPPLPE